MEHKFVPNCINRRIHSPLQSQQSREIIPIWIHGNGACVFKNPATADLQSEPLLDLSYKTTALTKFRVEKWTYNFHCDISKGKEF